MDEYDYLVVGAGSAGCAIAARLSEDADERVLLLEAGPPADHFWINTPGGVSRLFDDRRYNWCFTTEPNESLGGRTLHWPRGKTLGGSSAINGMVYMRGHPRDFDHWAELGNKGWGWDDVLPYFKKSEDNTRGTGAYTGTGGPLSVSDPTERHPITRDFLKSVAALGVPEIEGLNFPPFEGVAYQQFTIRRGKRETSYTAFIKPIRHRRNLTVLTNLTVLRILITNGEATGVEVLDRAQKRVIRARREVILSAGALASPQLLLLSGIGDGSEVRQLGLPLVADTPGVGKNLQDHWAVPYVLRVGPDGSYNPRLSGYRKYLEGMRYLLTRRGFLALGSSAVSTYVKSSEAETQPDLQLAIRPVSAIFNPDGSVDVDPEPGVGGAVVLVGPKSTGYLALRSPDPLQAPAFHPRYLGHPDDAARLIRGVHLLRRVFESEPLASRIKAEVTPGPGVQTDAQILDFIKRSGNTAWHPVGTCKMGMDPMAVVNSRLRVHGLRRLRVADASIMPRITSGNTNAPSIMIGEKAADMIKQDKAPRRQ